MQWPLLSGKSREAVTQAVFGGLNRLPGAAETEFYHMENLTARQYPLLSPRPRRGIFHRGEHLGGLIAKDSLCWIEGKNFVINGYALDLGLAEGEKQLVSMGAYVIIFPDKVYVNTADLTDFGPLEASFTTQAPARFTLCRSDGSEFLLRFSQPEQPESPANLDYWLDTGTQTLKQWLAGGGLWLEEAAVCVKISSPGLGKAFSQGDGVFLRGLTGTLTDGDSGADILNSTDLEALEGNHVLQTRGEDFVVIPGILLLERTISNPVTLSREIPRMDFVIQRENRLWGCRYGPDREGKVVNEIYASKLGDFKNFHCFEGLSTDSYALSVGSDGPFTGAVTYGGYPLFWKEGCVHKLFGTIPANFGIQTTPCRGVQSGCGESLAIVGELLYYKSPSGIFCYDGSLPVPVSEQLGPEPFEQAAAGAWNNRYYVSMKSQADGAFHLFVYDTRLSLWHREDNFQVTRFCTCQGELYALEGDRIWALGGSGEPGEGAVSWLAETGPLGLTMDGGKTLSRLVLRLSLGIGSRLRLSIQYDSRGPWVRLCSLSGLDLKSFRLPVRPRRCDHFRLRLEGEGEARVYSMTKYVSQGSDR